MSELYKKITAYKTPSSNLVFESKADILNYLVDSTLKEFGNSCVERIKDIVQKNKTLFIEYLEEQPVTNKGMLYNANFNQRNERNSIENCTEQKTKK